jgi:hypothetical protein
MEMISYYNVPELFLSWPPFTTKPPRYRHVELRLEIHDTYTALQLALVPLTIDTSAPLNATLRHASAIQMGDC